jgi:hypothetical protein
VERDHLFEGGDVRRRGQRLRRRSVARGLRCAPTCGACEQAGRSKTDGCAADQRAADERRLPRTRRGEVHSVVPSSLCQYAHRPGGRPLVRCPYVGSCRAGVSGEPSRHSRRAVRRSSPRRPRRGAP